METLCREEDHIQANQGRQENRERMASLRIIEDEIEANKQP